MKNTIKRQLIQAAKQLLPELTPEIDRLPIVVEWTRDPTHGDLAGNAAMLLAKQAKQPPRQLAEQLIAHLNDHPDIERIEIAGPGFINFFLSNTCYQSVIPTVLDAQATYGQSNYGAGKRVHIEYVSANPTGPLHVGHGRGAAHGATVANLLAAIGFNVHREYYVNDAGRQMAILAVSVWLRYLTLTGCPLQFPDQGYKGSYVVDIATTLYEQHGDSLKPDNETDLETLFADLPSDEKDIDLLIKRSQRLLGESRYQRVFNAGLDAIEHDIRTDLSEFGVNYDSWLRESTLIKQGLVDDGIATLKKYNHVYTKEGALWFRATDFGDEKDRVLRRADGRHTYFAADVAYHLYKYQQGYDLIIDVFGADHHGYIARIQAFLKALGCDTTRLTISLVQFAILYRGKTKVQMSTRSGEFVTLRELRQEVGNDAARFFYSLRKANQHLDFDLELAISHSQDNPVYYVQYAHARIHSVLEQAVKQMPDWSANQGLPHLARLTAPQEKALIQALWRYPDCLEQAATQHEPHLLVYFLQSLATTLHSYYNNCPFLLPDKPLCYARLSLIVAVKQLLTNGLTLLGVSAPNKM